jgi:hypothetical protein
MEERIISAVYKREEVWNPRNFGHRNVNVLQKRWLEIAAEVGRDGEFFTIICLFVYTVVFVSTI